MDDGCRRQSDESGCPNKFQRTGNAEYVAEQKEVKDREGDDESQPPRLNAENDRRDGADDQHEHVQFREAEAGSEVARLKSSFVQRIVMRWTVSITEFAHRDKNRLIQGAHPNDRDSLKREIDAAFRSPVDDARKRGEIMFGNRFQKVLDVGRIPLILDLNMLDVADPEDDRICWILGVMLVPD